jgi:peptidyl-prolyl cis-trans isomerase C
MYFTMSDATRMGAALVGATILGLVAPLGGALAADDPVVATVNGAEIHQSEVSAFRAILPAKIQGMDEAQVTTRLIERLTQVKALAQEAEKSGITKDAAYKKLQAQKLEEFAADSYIKSVIDKKVTDKAIRDLYDTTVAGGKSAEEFRARHILVDSEDEAKDLIKQIKGGKDFAVIAKEKSKDTGSAANGGDLGWFTPDVMVPEFSKAAVALKNGEISAPVKSQFGWHIIQTQERRKQAPPKFEDVKENLSQQLKQQINQETVERVTKAAKIELKGAAAAPKIVPAK